MRKSFSTPLVMAAAFAAAGCGAGKEAPSPAPEAASEQRVPSAVATERDPVCGMFVDPKTSPKSEYEGQTYYFCSLEDKERFDKDPGNFTSQAP